MVDTFLVTCHRRGDGHYWIDDHSFLDPQEVRRWAAGKLGVELGQVEMLIVRPT
jgi:hypothetical protein